MSDTPQETGSSSSGGGRERRRRYRHDHSYGELTLRPCMPHDIPHVMNQQANQNTPFQGPTDLIPTWLCPADQVFNHIHVGPQSLTWDVLISNFISWIGHDPTLLDTLPHKPT